MSGPGDMEYRQLGPSCGLRVSRMSMGTITFGGAAGMEYVGRVNADEAARMFDLCLERGINMVDTANFYSRGLSEEVVGAALSASRFDSLLVTSKVRMVMGDGPNDGGSSRWHILDQIDETLGRLGRDHVDLYYLHEWDGQTSLEETLQTMDGLVKAGKVRYYGLSDFTAWQLMKVLMTCERHGFIKPVCQQVYYTPQAREVEFESIPAALDQGLGTAVWGPLAMGLLTGKYKRDGSAPDGARQKVGKWTDVRVADPGNLYDMVDALSAIADDKGATVAQVALAWTMARPGISTVVIGARSVDQLRETTGALDVTLTDAETAAIDKVSPPPMLFPFWHQATFTTDRLGDSTEGIVNTMIDNYFGDDE